MASVVIGSLIAALVSGLGILMLVSPVRWSRILNSLGRAQLNIIRGGSLFGMYFPERVERSRLLRTQIRVLGLLFFAAGILIVFQSSHPPVLAKH